MRRLFLLAAVACAHAAPQPAQKVVFTEPEVITAEDPVQVELRLAKQEYDQGQKREAAARLQALAARPGLPVLTRASALVQEGVCRIETGERAQGEILLRQALEICDTDHDEPVDPTLPAQAEFWLGESLRAAFREQKLDPSTMDEKALGDALEQKAQFLLSAQGHYLRSIRRGDGEWATASGYCIGEMYEELHDQMISAPPPRGLTEGQRALYQEQLRDKVKNLVGKAIRMYEETLSVAQRTGASSGYVKKTEEALERLRRLLLDRG